MTTGKCDICHRDFPEGQLITGHGIRHEIEDLIAQDVPGWDDYKKICQDDFDKYRKQYVSTMIEEESGNIRTLEQEVLQSINDNALLASNTNTTAREKMKLGDRIADKVATFGGSWTFILIFFGVLLGWIGVNTFFLLEKPFDPYPYILMNLILSCVAAIQAPIIMMSQNRQTEKDRLQAENDYKVNLKSEIEIRTLHEKVDHLLLDQWAKMMKIQEIQIEILEEIRDRKK